MTNPFRDLDLPATAELTDDDVRAAWRRAAAATHPDREDGGEPPAFAAAAAAYAVLRTQAGRRDALADMREGAHGRLTPGPVPSRIRPVRLALRVLAVAAASWLAVAAVGWQPASAAVIAGAVTWLVRTGRRDLA
jgi:hypothetical protein